VTFAGFREFELTEAEGSIFRRCSKPYAAETNKTETNRTD
jgi:hypothetical protein